MCTQINNRQCIATSYMYTLFRCQQNWVESLSIIGWNHKTFAFSRWTVVLIINPYFSEQLSKAVKFVNPWEFINNGIYAQCRPVQQCMSILLSVLTAYMNLHVLDNGINALFIFRPHRICVAYRCDHILSHVHGLSVCESVCLSFVMPMYCGKTTGPIEMPFGMWGRVGQSK